MLHFLSDIYMACDTLECYDPIVVRGLSSPNDADDDDIHTHA